MLIKKLGYIILATLYFTGLGFTAEYLPKNLFIWVRFGLLFGIIFILLDWGEKRDLSFVHFCTKGAVAGIFVGVTVGSILGGNKWAIIGGIIVGIVGIIRGAMDARSST